MEKFAPVSTRIESTPPKASAALVESVIFLNTGNAVYEPEFLSIVGNDEIPVFSSTSSSWREMVGTATPFLLSKFPSDFDAA